MQSKQDNAPTTTGLRQFLRRSLYLRDLVEQSCLNNLGSTANFYKATIYSVKIERTKLVVASLSLSNQKLKHCIVQISKDPIANSLLC